NMGCPFPPQVRKGRGAGIILHPEVISEIGEEMKTYAGSIEFSVKMRLGVKDPSEALRLADILNEMPLRHIAIHPRTAAQQYKGELLLDDLAVFTSKLNHPVIFNGEITSPKDIEALSSRYDGVMAGRGFLRRPSIFAEYLAGREMNADEIEGLWLRLIKGTASELEKRLCGVAQLRDKMKPYWEYAPISLDKKIVKQGRKQ
ncbi:MAG: tRNA-dihydrouridine synthase family protein, partial [Muribaculaceae bacterium]|nr:tRNA-dihydrouridine synthase family protein [Muribaculaceae bacterium]